MTTLVHALWTDIIMVVIDVFKITKKDLGILTLYYLMRYLINI